MNGRIALAVLSAIVAGGAVSQAQQQRVPEPGTGRVMTAVRPSTVVETRITTGRPYSAEATTEFTQVLGDGNRISRKGTVRIYRDGDGRTRREELGSDGSVKSISINDPVAHVTYVLDPSTRTARKSALRIASLTPSTALTDEERKRIEARMAGDRGSITLAAPAEASAQPATEEVRRRLEEVAAAAGGRGRGVLQPAVRVLQNAKEESLGQKLVEGVMADGKRVTTVLPAGAIGNQQPITILSEQWFSPDLEVLLMTRHSDPRSGETTYTLTNVVRAEPAAGLFDVPADYTVRDSTYIRTPAMR